MFLRIPLLLLRQLRQMINADFHGLEEYRNDGRKSQEMRGTSLQIAVDSNSDGSCHLKQGLTEVLCLVRGPYQRPSNTDFLLKIEYTVAPFSSLQRRKSKYDREFTEFVENIRKSFEGIIIADLYKKNQIEILVTVLQNEGSAKSAVMNCISIALINAGICMRDMLVSCTVGMLNTRIIVDPNENEQYDISNQFVISYLSGTKSLDCVELKKAKLKDEQLKEIYRVAVSSCWELYNRMRRVMVASSLKNMLIF